MQLGDAPSGADLGAASRDTVVTSAEDGDDGDSVPLRDRLLGTPRAIERRTAACAQRVSDSVPSLRTSAASCVKAPGSNSSSAIVRQRGGAPASISTVTTTLLVLSWRAAIRNSASSDCQVRSPSQPRQPSAKFHGALPLGRRRNSRSDDGREAVADVPRVVRSSFPRGTRFAGFRVQRAPANGGIASCRQIARAVPVGISRCLGTGVRRSLGGWRQMV